MKYKIYKLSHGNLSPENYAKSIEEKLAVVGDFHGSNKPSKPYQQGKDFADAPNGSFFFLCHPKSGKISLIGRLKDTNGDTREKYEQQNRFCRDYDVIFESNNKLWQEKNFRKKWSPSGNSTFHEVPKDDLEKFEALILKPFFGKNLSDLEKFAKSQGEDMPIIKYPYEKDPTKAETSMQPANIIFYGPPGTGKTFKLTHLMQSEYGGRFKFVTFHQSYGYEDFVEGLRPVLTKSSKEEVNVDGATLNNGFQQIGYEIKDGIFKEICTEARKRPDLRYAIFIDEINRGNVSKIFGELITLIEIDKRDYYKEGEKPFVEVTLPYSRENFSVPCNLDIIGTMNTADRSLAPLDIALRRRFEFVPLIPDTRKESVDVEPHSAPLAGLKVGNIDIRLMLEKINERIEVLSNRDRCIGHAYFIPLKSNGNGERLVELSKIFKDQIIPLLEEYFFDDWKKIGQVLGDHNKSSAEIKFIVSEEIDRSDLLGEDKGEWNKDSSVRYRLNPKVFIDHAVNEEVYVGIYKKVTNVTEPKPSTPPAESQ